MLDVQGLTCFRQNRCLFADLSFQIQAGDICQVEGPNGAGKSTLLRTLLGLFRPEEGEVFWNGNQVSKQQDEFYADCLYLGHKLAVNPSQTPVENLQTWAAMHPSRLHDIQQALDAVGLTGLENVSSHALSAGQHRKVALARLWLTNAKLWILDEPFTAIDKAGVALLQQRFEQHLAAGGIILLTTHQDLSHQFSSLIRVTLSHVEGEL